MLSQYLVGNGYQVGDVDWILEERQVTVEDDEIVLFKYPLVFGSSQGSWPRMLNARAHSQVAGIPGATEVGDQVFLPVNRTPVEQSLEEVLLEGGDS